MSFKLDYSDVIETSLLPVGEYEAVIKLAFRDATKGGTEYINVPLVIRNDVEQPRQNAHIWHSIWRRKQPVPADAMFEGYSSAQLLRLCKSAGIPANTEFDSFDTLLDALAGLPVRVTVGHEEYNGRTSARVKYINPSRYPDCNHKFQSQQPGEGDNLASGEAIGFDTSDLPF